MRQLILTGICALGVACVVAADGRAETITLVEKSLSELLGGSYTALGSLMETDMSSGNLHSEVHSRAYTGGSEYAYLYQVFNTGTTGNSSAELFTLGEFFGSITSGNIGYLTGALPTGFSVGGQLPESDAFVDSMPGGLETSFYYTKRAGYSIDPGEQSRVMFIRSTHAPGVIDGSVIDHDVGHGPVVGAVPEPATLILLALAGFAALTWHMFDRTR